MAILYTILEIDFCGLRRRRLQQVFINLTSFSKLNYIILMEYTDFISLINYHNQKHALWHQSPDSSVKHKDMHMCVCIYKSA